MLEPTPSPHPTPRALRAPSPAREVSLGDVVRRGLSADPKHLPPVLFYDSVGSRLFERICRTPEYYVTRTEHGILTRPAAAIAALLPRTVTLVELGCGSAEKTQILLRELVRAGHRTRFVACDVSSAALERTVARLHRELPALEVVPVAGDFAFAIAQAPRLVQGGCVWTFLGSNLGNLEPQGARAFLASLDRALDANLLLGVDMVKPVDVLHAAYDDAEGVTAAFNRNVLVRINRELDADFVPDRFEHRAVYRPERRRVEMHLVSQVAQRVRIRQLDLEIDFAAGETIHTENSHKYTDEDLADLARVAGFTPVTAWQDDDRWFTFALWRGRAGAG